MHRIIKTSMIAIAGMSLLGLGYNSLPNHQVNAHAASEINSKYNNYLTNVRIAKAAKQRTQYYYSNQIPVTRNIRDLGGITTSDGNYVIKNDRLIRGGDLSQLTKQGANKLNHLNIKHIFDLRESEEIKAAPDPGEGIKNKVGLKPKIKNIPVISLKEKIASIPYKNKYGEIYRYGNQLVDSPSAIKAYKSMFNNALKNKNGAIFYHCTGGRDRTGTVTALYLNALGVNNRDIYNDYLLSAYYNGGIKHQRQNYVHQMAQLGRFYSTIQSKYGSVDNYLHNVIGLTNNDINKLRSNYLTPTQKGIKQQQNTVKNNLTRWISTHGQQRRINKVAYYQSKNQLKNLQKEFNQNK